MDAILWIVRTRAPLRDLPQEFGPWRTVYHHFNQWSSLGVNRCAKVRRCSARETSLDDR